MLLLTTTVFAVTMLYVADGVEVINVQSDSHTEMKDCDSHSTCQEILGDAAYVCCGSCQDLFCCNDTSRAVNFSECRSDSLEASWIGSNTLAVVIGCMVIFFVLALILKWIFKRVACDSCKRSNVSDFDEAGTSPSTIGENGRRATSLPEIQPPPSYGEIKLYTKMDHSKAQAIYYTVPGVKSYYGIVAETSVSYDDEHSNTGQVTTISGNMLSRHSSVVDPPPYSIAMEESATFSSGDIDETAPPSFSDI